MYKDKALQREKTAERVRRYRDKGVTQGVTDKVVLPANIVRDIERVLSDRAILGLPDDSEDRWRLAKEYQVWNDDRLSALRKSAGLRNGIL